MSWMHNYKKPSADDEGAFNYMDDQEVAIKKVRDKMLSAIANAQNFLDNEI